MFQYLKIQINGLTLKTIPIDLKLCTPSFYTD